MIGYEWDYVKFSEGQSLGDMEVLIGTLRMKHQPGHHFSKMIGVFSGSIAKD